MESLKSYNEFINESINRETMKRVFVSFNTDLGKVEDSFILAMSDDSTGLYRIGKDIEKFCGIPEKDVIADVKAGRDRPDGAVIYGMSNIMNGGRDIYFWTNGTRLVGAINKIGLLPAICEQVSHECIHLTRKILTRHIAKLKGASLENEEWVKFDFGAGEYNWPGIGDMVDSNPLIQIDEEVFATALGLVVQETITHFMEMYEKKYTNGKDTNISGVLNRIS